MLYPAAPGRLRSNRKVIENLSVATGGMLCCHVLRAFPEST
jgi:hypothetical protein